MNVLAALVWVTSHTWILAIAAALLYVVLWVQERRRQHSVFSRLGIPHVPPHLIYGSNHVLRGRGAIAINVVAQWTKRYGKVFGYYVGWRPTLVVADLDLVKQVLIKDFNTFSNRPKLVVAVQPVVDTVVGLRDQRWKDVRSILTPTFSMVKMKHMTGIMNRKIDLLMTILEEKIAQEQPIEWYTTYQGLTLDVISECVLAMKSNCQRDQNKDQLFVAVRDFLQNAVNPAITLALYFPVFADLLSFVANKLALSGRMTQMIVNHLKSVISVRRKDLGTKNVDVLQLMLEAAESRYADDDGPAKQRHKLLTDAEIIANSWVFLLGGFETTASTLTYTTYLLATHPQVQERVYEELCRVTQEDEINPLTYDEVKNLKYLDQVMSESLRLYPPVVTFITREAANDFKLGDITVLKDMIISVPIWQLHRDPEQWPDPEKFDPERFSPEARAASTQHPMAYLPFGAGPRNCPGLRFSQLEAKLSLARVIKTYRLETCKDTPVPLSFKIPSVTINPTKPIYIRAVPRDSIPSSKKF